MTNNKHTQLVDFSNPSADKITSASTQAPMTNNKQSSVEWLEEIYLTKGINRDIHFHQAKAIHKEEIVKAWSNGYDEDDRATSSPLKYYNETFK